MHVKTFTGREGEYFWLACHECHWTIPDYFVRRYPAVFLDRTVAVTASDSMPEPDPFWIADAVSIEELPPLDGWDEWWIFEGPPQPRDMPDAFVNIGSFSLAPLGEVHPPDPTWDRSTYVVDANLRSRFWAEVVRLNPESYLAVGDTFLFASRREELVSALGRDIRHGSF